MGEGVFLAFFHARGLNFSIPFGAGFGHVVFSSVVIVSTILLEGRRFLTPREHLDMVKVSVNDITPGMVLAEDLSSETGRFLLGRGTVIEEKHQRIFKIWGVAAVDIDSDEHGSEFQARTASAESLEQARVWLRRRFRLNDPGYPLLRELYKLCVHNLALRIEGGFTLPKEPLEETECNNPDVNHSLHTTPDEVLGGDEPTMASMPAVLSELINVINNPRCSALEVARVVEKDTTLTAKLLRIVNSPFYGFPSKIDTISRAVTVVGSRQLTTLAVGVAAINYFQGIPSGLVDMTSFWRHSLRVGFCSRLLASYTNTPNSERYFVAGLLHDIGRLIFYKARSEESAQVLALARTCRECNHHMERKVFGFDHAVLGGGVLKKWNFPVVLESAVRYHHAPMQSPNFRESALVHFADIVAWSVDFGHAGVIPPFNATAWESLSLPTATLPMVVEQLEFLFTQSEKLFLSDG